MSHLGLQKGIIYGPILSQRLGRSLGINLLPVDKKLCSFNCVYCQYGFTDILATSPKRELFPTVDQVVTAIEAYLKKPHSIDYITFSGNGEPTLYPEFGEIVEETVKLRKRYRPNAKLAILSNASMISRYEIRQALTQIDKPILKLDAGDVNTFEQINGPFADISFEDIVKGMKLVDRIIFQTTLYKGELGNISKKKLDNWMSVLVEIKPIEVQIYSTERPVADNRVINLDSSELKNIAKAVHIKTGLVVKPFYT